MEIDLDKYLSEEEKADIAREEFRATCRMKSHQDFERIINNSLYRFIYKQVDSCIDFNLKTYIRKKLPEIIGDLSTRSIFRRKDVWEKENSKGYEILQETIKDCKPYIEKKVKNLIKNCDLPYAREELTDSLSESLFKVLFNKDK